MTRDYIITKYNKTNILDPVKMSYFDENKNREEDIKLTTKILGAKEKKVNNLPPSTKYSEGRSYNILRPQVGLIEGLILLFRLPPHTGVFLCFLIVNEPLYNNSRR